MSDAILGRTCAISRKRMWNPLASVWRRSSPCLRQLFAKKAKPGGNASQDWYPHAAGCVPPCYACVDSSSKAAGMKWVAGYPQNSKHGLPYVTGLLILNDYETGVPLALMDCIWITASELVRRPRWLLSTWRARNRRRWEFLDAAYKGK